MAHSPVRYEVTTRELSFSGVESTPHVASVTGPGAKRRALLEAELEFPRNSVISVTVTQRGGAGDGTVVLSKINPEPFISAGTEYCAGVKALGNGRFEFRHAVSRDSRLTHTTPVAYTTVIETVEAA